MNNPDLLQMEQEIIRLNKIITVLLEQIDTIKANYNHLLHQVQTNQLHDGQVLRQMGMNQENDSHVEQDMGIKQVHSSHMAHDTGINKENPSHVTQDMGTNKMNASHVMHEMPIKQMNDSRMTHEMPIKQVNDPNVMQDMQAKQVIFPEVKQPPEANEVIYTLPPTLMDDNANINLLSGKLRVMVMKRSRESARQGVAKLLIHFYNKGTGKYEELQKLTGYSQGGLAKLMMMMSRKMLVLRVPYKQFKPSPKALQLMQEAKLK